MDKVINTEILKNCFEDIIRIQDIGDNEINEFNDNIEKLDFLLKKIKFVGLKEYRKPDIVLIKKIGYYLFGYLSGKNTNAFNIHISSFKKEGLNISALIFELLSDYDMSDEVIKIYGSIKNKYLFYSSICYSLCGKEANSIYIAKKIDYNISEYKYFFILIGKTLQRDFRGIINNHLIKNEFKNNGLLKDLTKIFYDNANLFVEGNTNIDVFYENIKLLKDIKNYLVEVSDVNLLFIVSRTEDVVIEMINNSVWSILLPLGFSNQYILSLTKHSNKTIYELWEGQRNIIKNLFNTDDNRILINMPTSGGKTQIAELLIINELEKDIGKKIIYVVPTNALANQIEDGFFNRFRGLGYKVSSNVDVGNETDDIIDDVIIVTPEKLDLLIRKEPEFINTIGLIIFDEFHKINDGDRGLLLETLFSFLMLKQDLEENSFKIVTLSAIIDSLNNINVWFGNDNGLFQSTWTPTRKLFGILKAVHHNNHILGKDNINVHYNLEYKYNNLKGIIRDLFKLNVQFKNEIGVLSNNKLKKTYKSLLVPSIFELVEKIYKSDKSHILIYFAQKEAIYSFIKDKNLVLYGNRLKGIFDIDNIDDKIINLKRYLEFRLSSNHPLTKIIEFGIGYHTADLPKDVRIEIENAYKNKTIKLLLSTSTLADGVNLPIKSLIFHNPYLINIPDFRNVIGRVGRATETTEGNIFFVNEFVGEKKINDNISNKLVIKSSLSNIKVDAEYYDFLDYISGLDESERDKKVREFDRLQIFIYSVYEYLKENNQEITINDVKNVVSKGLYFIDKTDIYKEKFNTYYNYAYDNVEIIYKESPYTLKIMNKTGLSDKSFWDMYEVGNTINFEPNENINVLGIDILNPYPKIKELITEDIFNKLLEIKEFNKVIVKNKFDRLENYNILFSWINGYSFLEIRDNFFDYEKDIIKRTSVSVKYITVMFEYILPWAFSSLSILCEGLNKTDNIIREIRLLPIKAKHGVKTEYGIELVRLGIEYHELLVGLEKVYLNEMKLYDEKNTNLDIWDRTIFIGINDWLLNKSFHSLEKELVLLNNNTSFIKNIGKVKNKLKDKSNELDIKGKLTFIIKGISNNEFKKYDISKIDNKEDFKFQRDYNNIYDYFAIKILYGDGHLGYIESDYSEELSEYIKNGVDFEVIEIKNDGKNIELIIGIKDVF